MSETAPYPAFINDSFYAIVFPGAGLDGSGVYKRTTSAHILGSVLSIKDLDNKFYLSGEEKITNHTKIVKINIETEEVK